MELRRMGVSDASVVLAASRLFDDPPTLPLVTEFLARQGHHLIIAFVDDQAAGFVSGIEVAHPDKPTELMLYEIGVDASFRRRGVGRALVQALLSLAAARSCRGVWAPVEADDERALAFYRAIRHGQRESAEIFWWDVEPADRPPA